VTGKREKPLALGMPFGEALERFLGVEPAELPENVKLRTGKRRGRRSDPHPRRELTMPLPARRGRASEPGYPLAGAPVRADVLDPAEAEAVVGGDEDHRSHLPTGVG